MSLVLISVHDSLDFSIVQANVVDQVLDYAEDVLIKGREGYISRESFDSGWPRPLSSMDV